MNKEYYLCSKSVVDFAKPKECSKPFKSGFKFDSSDDYYVAVLNFEDIERHFNELDKDSRMDFWCQQIVPGTYVLLL